MTDFKTHEITHKISQKKEKHFKCEKCGQNFKDLSDCHKLKNFSAAAPVTEFGRKEDLKKHERTHRNQSEPRNERNEQRMTNPKQFSCDECEMKFKTEKDLQSREKSHTCPQ